MVYINDLLKSIQNSKEGIFASKVQFRRSVTGLMFVDDLHILSNSTEGICNTMKNLVNKAQQDDVIAKAAHSEMAFRGFNQGNLGRATITKIINSTIAPILT
jgi:hypothetical protein